MIALVYAVVGIIFLVCLGGLFLEVSKPGHRLIPATIIAAALTGGILLERVNPELGVATLLFGALLGFVVAALSAPRSGSGPGNGR